VKSLQDHEIKAWLTGAEYLAATHAAEDDCRSLSGYLRYLVRQDLALRASSMAGTTARDDLGPARAEERSK
jgi:hypothetical protein